MKRSRPKLATMHGMTEGEKRRLMKETGPVTTEILAETVIETHVQKANPTVRAPLRRIFDDYRDLFPSKLPYGPPPKRKLGPRDSSGPRGRVATQKPIQAQQYKNGGTQTTD